jgi:hypothetical protein
MQIGRDGFDKVREEIKNCYLVEETVDPYSIKGLSHIQKNKAPVSLITSKFLDTCAAVG